MTIREIFDESVRACMDKKITEDAHLKVLNTKIVPRKLVEDAIKQFQARIVDLCYAQDAPMGLQGERIAYKDCIRYLQTLLNELEGEENEDSD